MIAELPPSLVAAAHGSPEGRAWLDRLPAERARLAERWSLSFESERAGADATCSYVAFVRLADGSPAVLKMGLPHMEAEDEAAGLRFWSGEPTIRLLDADDARGALLLERCDPGFPLSRRPEPERDEVIAGLLRRLWRAPPPGHLFRPLVEMARYWADVALARPAEWPDAGLARAGAERLVELAAPSESDVLLATDLHAGNVLRARREPWLVIDPKPFLGDRSFDATQHLLNSTSRLIVDACGTVARFSELLGVKQERVHAWLFARLAVHTQRSQRTFELASGDAIALALEHERRAR